MNGEIKDGIGMMLEEDWRVYYQGMPACSFSFSPGSFPSSLLPLTFPGDEDIPRLHAAFAVMRRCYGTYR